MVTPYGHLYSKEAILQNLLRQKKELKKKLAAWEAAQAAEAKKVGLGVGLGAAHPTSIFMCMTDALLFACTTLLRMRTRPGTLQPLPRAYLLCLWWPH